MCEVVAKKSEDGRKQSLDEHTFNVIEEALNLIHDDELNVISEKTGVDKTKIEDLIFFSAYFHDIGKATDKFKKTIDNKNKSYHSFYSASLVIRINDFNFNNVNLLMLIILTHHTVFNQDSSFKTAEDGNTFKFEFINYAEEFFYKYKYAYEKYMRKECKYNFVYKEATLKEISNIIRCTYGCIDSHKLVKCNNHIKLRVLYSYVTGILTLSDWIASAKFNRTMPQIEFNGVPSKEYIYKELSKSLKIEKFVPRNFQSMLSDFKGNVLVEIPTGEGKTEGSFLWGVKNLKGNWGKIIYTLPTQTTSNKLYERAKSVFHNNTGLIHGSSKVYLEKEYEKENGKIDNKCDSNILFSQTFNKGCTISTIDSLFKYFLNIGRYNIAMLNFIKSSVIIDEVHSYDFKMMGFMKRFLEICNLYKVPVCIMSASIPNKTKKLIGIDRFTIITDKKLFSKKANYIYKVDDSIDNNMDIIVDKYNSGRNVLIVRNNIKNSVKTYKDLKNKNVEDIILYNSQFKKKDRIRKEDEIYDKLKNNEHFILVATQVVEISLDIDFDVMYTDNAPIDSLIQRFGRVNRNKNINKLGEVFVFKKVEEKPYYYKLLEITYDTIQEGLFTIGKYNEWLNIVYDMLYGDKRIEDEIQDKFTTGYKMFDKIIKNLHGIEQSDDFYNLRDIQFPKKDFILEDDYDKNCFEYENTVSLPIYLARPELGYLIDDKFGQSRYDILNLKYNYDTGVKMPNIKDLDLFLGE
ncbi:MULTISPECIES: CRISPR-associated helicase/endonuclease Cas3 [Clostridium]|uniref:CRISPR-associated helicase/endonuclease Cas3 n=1 Tax=Clostridium TaxID=1485 RepID=UPI000826A27E|nr:MULTISPECIES: CRISPR-associated helicase/endonuclease Cas3 [Clostridium]PJI07102.1 CRISPR-associated helicase/endonuclease Cas3 [Clostridium sp. CT7]